MSPSLSRGAHAAAVLHCAVSSASPSLRSNRNLAMLEHRLTTCVRQVADSWDRSKCDFLKEPVRYKARGSRISWSLVRKMPIASEHRALKWPAGHV